MVDYNQLLTAMLSVVSALVGLYIRERFLFMWKIRRRNRRRFRSN